MSLIDDLRASAALSSTQASPDGASGLHLIEVPALTEPSGAERRRRAAGPRRSWASPEPFVVRSAALPVREPRSRWNDQSNSYVLRSVMRDLIICTAVPTVLLFLVHTVSLLQLAWGVGIGLLFVVMIAVGRGYERRELGDGPVEFQAGINAGILTAAALALLAVGLDFRIPRTIVFGALPLMVLATTAGRHLSRRALHRRRERGESMMATLVVGDATSVERVVSDLRGAPYHGYQISGMCLPSLDDTPPSLGLPVLGALADIPQVVKDGGYEVVIIAGSELSGHALRRLSWALQAVGAELVVAPGLVEVFGPRVSIEPTAGLSLMHVRHADSSRVRPTVKRTFDWVAASLGLVVLSPLLLAIAIGVRVSSRGPVLFRQTRVGQRGQEFTMLKFRSMVVDAEAHVERLRDQNQAQGPLFKLADDPRVTRLGRFLRKHSLDELPQLFNVVRGEMSLVGPRPPLPREVDQYVETARRRLLVKPGLTGLWQVSGRADLPWNEAVKLDLRYVENWSIALDLMIIWKTVTVVLNGHGGR